MQIDTHDIPDIKILSSKRSRAQVEHKCSCCAASIKEGEVYKAVALVEDGDFKTYKVCGRHQ